MLKRTRGSKVKVVPRPDIVVGGKRVSTDEDGDYCVGRKLIEGVTLSTLPPNTSISIRYPNRHRSELVRVLRLVGPASSGFDVFADFFNCYGCWDHAIDYLKYMRASEGLIQSAKARGITYDNSIKNPQAYHIRFSMTRHENTVASMEQGILSDVNKTVDSLIQFSADVDREMQRQFGV